MLAKSILISLWWCFALTLMLFPNIFYVNHFDFVDNWKLSNTDKKSWYFILQTILFNIGDTIGRYLGGIFHLPTKAIVSMSLIRVIFALTTTLIALDADPVWLF